jgi:hypothetical protein
MTGLTMRINSSTAFGSSDMSAFNASRWSGNSVSSFIEPEIVLRVVSLPANTISSHEPSRYSLRKQLTVHGGARDRAHQIRFRIGAALLQHVLAVFEHLGDVLVERLDELQELRCRRLRHPCAASRDVSRRLRDSASTVMNFGWSALRHAEDLAQREQRQLRGELFDQSRIRQARPCCRSAGVVSVGDLLLQLGQIGRREIRACAPCGAADARLPVHVDHGVNGGAEQQLGCRVSFGRRS